MNPKPENSGPDPGMAPKTFYQELAQHGDLFSFVKEYLPDVFDRDERFRKKVFTLILQNSPEIVPEIEEYLLDEIRHSLEYFLKETEACRK